MPKFIDQIKKDIQKEINKIKIQYPLSDENAILDSYVSRKKVVTDDEVVRFELTGTISEKLKAVIKIALTKLTKQFRKGGIALSDKEIAKIISETEKKLFQISALSEKIVAMVDKLKEEEKKLEKSWATKSKKQGIKNEISNVIENQITPYATALAKIKHYKVFLQRLTTQIKHNHEACKRFVQIREVYRQIKEIIGEKSIHQLDEKTKQNIISLVGKLRNISNTSYETYEPDFQDLYGVDEIHVTIIQAPMADLERLKNEITDFFDQYTNYKNKRGRKNLYSSADCFQELLYQTSSSSKNSIDNPVNSNSSQQDGDDLIVDQKKGRVVKIKDKGKRYYTLEEVEKTLKELQDTAIIDWSEDYVTRKSDGTYLKNLPAQYVFRNFPEHKQLQEKIKFWTKQKHKIIKDLEAKPRKVGPIQKSDVIEFDFDTIRDILVFSVAAASFAYLNKKGIIKAAAKNKLRSKTIRNAAKLKNVNTSKTPKLSKGKSVTNSQRTTSTNGNLKKAGKANNPGRMSKSNNTTPKTNLQLGKGNVIGKGTGKGTGNGKVNPTNPTYRGGGANNTGASRTGWAQTKYLKRFAGTDDRFSLIGGSSRKDIGVK